MLLLFRQIERKCCTSFTTQNFTFILFLCTTFTDCLHLQIYRSSKDRYRNGPTKSSLSLDGKEKFFMHSIHSVPFSFSATKWALIAVITSLFSHGSPFLPDTYPERRWLISVSWTIIIILSPRSFHELCGWLLYQDFLGWKLDSFWIKKVILWHWYAVKF